MVSVATRLSSACAPPRCAPPRRCAASSSLNVPAALPTARGCAGAAAPLLLLLSSRRRTSTSRAAAPPRVESMARATRPVDLVAWETPFQELRAYAEANGPANVAHASSSLGNWLNNQRRNWRAGLLSPQQVSRLESLGLSAEPKAASWEENYEQLKAYAAANGGDTHVPRRKEDVAHRALARWCHAQREKKDMDPERKAKLDAIGFCWDVRRKTWTETHAELLAYAAANGGATRVPMTGATTLLARWVREQRERHKEGTLPAERVTLLEQLPSWKWRE